MTAAPAPTPVVVVGYDGSPAGRAAVALGIQRVGSSGRLIVVHSHGLPPDYVGVPFYQEMLDESTNKAAGVMEELEEALPDLRGVDYEPDIVIGPAADAICRVAEVRRADEIILGTRGLGRMRAVLGSVSHEVLHRAKCPVTVIPERMVTSREDVATEALTA
jgi:nucleotide-binding universal stress UspA family protein